MFDAFTRLLRQHLPWPAARDAQLLAAWAREHEVVLKRERQGSGLVLEHQVLRHPARLEWGPSQREYIKGRELRLRLELGLPEGLELMVMSRSLAERLEAQAYRQLTRGRQTAIDASLPEEARWLSMFDPVSLDDAAFNHAFVLVGASGSQARRWVDGELAVRLLRAQQRWLGEERAFVLMTLRGRLYLRLAVQALDEDLLDGLGLLAEAAAARALQLARRSARPDAFTADEARPAAAPDDGLASTLQPDPSGPLSDLVLGPGAPGLTVIEDALPSDFEPDEPVAARPAATPPRRPPPR